LGIATICSITLDGLLLNCGIPVNTSFAGVVEIRDHSPAEFTDLIAYAGSSIDPMRVFMARKMTRIADAVYNGSGRVLANVREVPIAAAGLAKKLLERSKTKGIDGLIGISEAGQPNLGCPVGQGRISIALYAGINGPEAVEESGIKIRNIPLSTLLDYSKMRELI
jgi:repressor of nif and glnA expression